MSVNMEKVYAWYGVNGSYVKLFFRNGRILIVPYREWYQFKDKILTSSYDDIRHLYTTFLVKG